MTETYYQVRTKTGSLITIPENQLSGSDTVIQEVARPVTSVMPSPEEMTAPGIPAIAGSLIGIPITKQPDTSIPASVAAPSPPAAPSPTISQEPEEIRKNQGAPAGDYPLPAGTQLLQAIAEGTEGIPFVRDITEYTSQVAQLQFYQEKYQEQVIKESERIKQYQEALKKVDESYKPIYDPETGAGIFKDNAGNVIVTAPQPQVPIPQQGSTFQPTISIGGSGSQGLFGELDINNLAKYGAIALIAILGIQILK